MADREIALNMVLALPDDATLDEIIDALETLAAIRRGEEAADAGKVVPHSEVERRLAEFLKRPPGGLQSE